MPYHSDMVSYPTGDIWLDSKYASGLQFAPTKFSKIQYDYFQEQNLFMLLRVCKIWSFSYWIFNFKKTAEVAFVTSQGDKALPLSGGGGVCICIY